MTAGPRGRLPDDVRTLLPQTFLADVPPDVAIELLEGGRALPLGPGGLVPRTPGRPGVALVALGLVRAFLQSARDRQVTVRYARPGEALGLVQLLGGRLDIHAQAVTATKLWVLPRRRLLDLAERDAPLALAIARDCAARVGDAVEELSLLSFGSVRQRLARHLLDLASYEPRDDALVAAVTQQELADATGSVREVVARELKALERGGRLVRSASGVVILDAAGLEAESRGGAGGR